MYLYGLWFNTIQQSGHSKMRNPIPITYPHITIILNLLLNYNILLGVLCTMHICEATALIDSLLIYRDIWNALILLKF